MSVFESQSHSGWHPLNSVNLKVMAGPKSTFSVGCELMVSLSTLASCGCSVSSSRGLSSSTAVPVTKADRARGTREVWSVCFRDSFNGQTKIKYCQLASQAYKSKLPCPPWEHWKYARMMVVWGNILRASRASNLRTKSGLVLNLDFIVTIYVQIWHESGPRLDLKLPPSSRR